MQLGLHADRQAVGEDPFREAARMEAGAAEDLEPRPLLEHGGHQDRSHAAGEVAFHDDRFGPVVVGAIDDDELDLVARSQVVSFDKGSSIRDVAKSA